MIRVGASSQTSSSLSLVARAISSRGSEMSAGVICFTYCTFAYSPLSQPSRLEVTEITET
jgi:hypothetical protein